MKNQSGFAPIQIIISIIAGTVVLGGIVGGVLYFSKQPNQQLSKSQKAEKIPYYFIAIHNEPFNSLNGRGAIQDDYLILKDMIKKADGYNIKLTLMLSAQWADYIDESSERMVELKSWEKNGHEISSHHHDLRHGNWDGYSYCSKEESEAKRKEQDKIPETYYGTLNDYIGKLKKINPYIKSGCVNDEEDKNALPDAIIYDTCSGFANYGEVGTRAGDGASEMKGRNDYITVGAWNGIKRYWLTHYQANSAEREPKGENSFSSMTSGVYGTVFHSFKQEKPHFDAYLEFLHSKDSKGDKSKTVSEIIEQKLIPEKEISEDLLKEKLFQSQPKTLNDNKQLPQKEILKKCGDNICDAVETANPNLCPTDCK